MRGIIVYDQSNDIAFLQADDALRIYLNGLAVSRGLMKPPGDHKPLNRDVVLQLLSPFMTSQRCLIGFMKTSYHSIRTENGFLFVFMQFNEHIYVAINGDGTESAEFLTRKLSVFNRILRFTLGPLSGELKPDGAQKRKERWTFIGQLLDTWYHLYNNEQSFLVEAIERLHVNEDLNCKCVGFVEQAFTTMKSKEPSTMHCLLFVNNQLLSLYSDSNASKLDASDILMIIVLINMLMSNSVSINEYNSSHLNDISDIEGVLSEPLVTPSVLESSLVEQPIDKEELCSLAEPSTGESLLAEPSLLFVPDARSSSNFIDGSSVSKELIEGDEKLESQQRNGSSFDREIPFSTFHDLKDEYNNDVESRIKLSNRSSSDDIRKDFHEEGRLSSKEKRVVFLQCGSIKHVPHTIQCVPITEAIMLVVVCQIPSVEDSIALIKLLESICLIQSLKLNSNTFAVHKNLEISIKAVLNIAQHYDNSEMVTKPLMILEEKWKEINSVNFIHQLEMAETTKTLEQQICYGLQQMHNQTTILLSRLFFLPRATTSDEDNILNDTFDKIRHRLRYSLHDYESFLLVKSQNNLALTTYSEMFPGLIHFIYVNRTTNQMTATSLANDVVWTTNKKEISSQDIRKNVWKIVEQMQKNLKEGYTSTTYRIDDLYYMYTLWFEDTMGKTLPILLPFKTSFKFTVPGILSHNFYKKMIGTCFPKTKQLIHCYEMITVHSSKMTKSLMHDHCRKLASILWQNSATCPSPVALF